MKSNTILTNSKFLSTVFLLTFVSIAFGQNVDLQNNELLRWKDTNGTWRSQLFAQSNTFLVTAMGSGMHLHFGDGTSSTSSTWFSNDTNTTPGSSVPFMINSNGNIGIGTSDPSTKLHLKTSVNSEILRLDGGARTTSFIDYSDGTYNSAGLQFKKNSTVGQFKFSNNNGDLMTIYSNGNVGIGTSLPDEILHVKDGNLLIEMNSQYANDPRILFQNDGNGANPYQTFYRWTGTGSNYFATRIYEGGNQGFKIQKGNTTTYGNHTFTDQLVLLKNGNLGIGVSSPSQKLQVAGTVYSTEVKVEVAAGQGPDYVFEPDYELRTLEETKKFIEENKHLPEIPSAVEMETNGVDLGDMNMRLLKKIEELTLYQIELLERIEQLEKKVN